MFFLEIVSIHSDGGWQLPIVAVQRGEHHRLTSLPSSSSPYKHHAGRACHSSLAGPGFAASTPRHRIFSKLHRIMPTTQYQPASLYDPHTSDADVEAGPSTPPPHPPRSPRIAAVQGQIDETIAVMRENIDRLTARGERIQDLESRTESLAESARGFRRSAKKVRRTMYWKDMKMRVIIALAVLVVVGLTVLSIVQAVRSKQPSPIPSKPTH